MNIQKVIGKDVGLWRYMDLSKLLDILVNKHLTFPRFDKFDDPFEGYANNYMELVKSAYYEQLSTTGTPFRVYMEIGSIRNKIGLINAHSYISCWHMNDFESAAMWKLYCNSSDAVAIKTSVGKLKSSLSNYVNEISFGGVSYDSSYSAIDKLEFFNIADPLFTKRESFEHEKEYRIIFHDYDSFMCCWGEMDAQHEKYHGLKLRGGEYIALSDEAKEILEAGDFYDLKNNTKLNKMLIAEASSKTPPIKQLNVNPIDFIEEIIISPDSPDWLFNTIKLTIEKLGYDLPIRKSKLYELN